MNDSYWIETEITRGDSKILVHEQKTYGSTDREACRTVQVVIIGS